MKFSEGDVVEVKLDGGIRVAGTIVAKKKASQYMVKYSDGGTHEIHERNIFPSERDELSPLGVRRARKGSPSRATTPPRPKSPARNRSPGRTRSPARTKSPARKGKQSPSPSREKSTRKKSPSRIMKLMVEKIDDVPLSERTSVEKPKLREFPRRRRAVEHDSSSPNKEINGSGDANSLKSSPKAESSLNSSKVLHLKPDYESSVVEPEEKSLKYDGKIKKEFGGWPGALITMIISPAMFFSLIHMCTKSSCEFRHFPKISLKPDTYFSKDVTLITFGYIALMYLLSVVPYVGKRVTSPNVTRDGKKHYKMNGLFSLLVCSAAIVALEKYNYSVSKIIIQNFMQFAILSMIIGLVLTIAMYIHSRYRPVSELNIHAVSGNVIYDLYMGRTTTPRILGFDIKLITLRASLLAVILINAIFVIKGIQNAIAAAATQTHKPTFFDVTQYWNMDLSLLLTAGLIVSNYCLDHLLFEPYILTTFEYMYEGFGYMLCMGYCIYPFTITLTTKYAFEHGIHWQLWQLIAVWTIYLPVIIMFRVINAQKNTFRSNPYNPAVAHLESIPTSQGKKLLVSGYWGIVRHPNYLVDIIQHLCLYSLAPCNPPAVMPLVSIFFILYRMYRDEKRCQARYGVAWDRYCHRVRYHLIPKVF